MGSRISQIGGSFFLPAAKHKDAFQAAQPIYGSYVEEGSTRNCFNLLEILSLWGYRATVDTEGNFVKLQCTNEKLGDEHKVFVAIAPYVRAGSYLEMTGDHGWWRWMWNGITCVEESPYDSKPKPNAATDKGVGKLLNSILVTCLGGPGGDPDEHHLTAAAKAFVALKKLGLPITNEWAESSLRGRNTYVIDFLEAEGLSKSGLFDGTAATPRSL